LCSHVQPGLEFTAIFLLLMAQWPGASFLIDLLPLRSVLVISDLWRCVGSLSSSGRSRLFPACVWLPVSIFLLEFVLLIRSPIVGSSHLSSVFKVLFFLRPSLDYRSILFTCELARRS
jgi:hypothetical protein